MACESISWARGISHLHHLAQQVSLGRFPVGRAEALADRQAPAGAQGIGIEFDGAVAHRLEALQHQVDVAHHDGLAGIDRHPRLGNAARRVEAGGDGGRVIALGGDQGAHLVRRILDEALQLVAVQAGIAAEAHQVEIVLQQFFRADRGRRCAPCSVSGWDGGAWSCANKGALIGSENTAKPICAKIRGRAKAMVLHSENAQASYRIVSDDGERLTLALLHLVPALDIATRCSALAPTD